MLTHIHEKRGHARKRMQILGGKRQPQGIGKQVGKPKTPGLRIQEGVVVGFEDMRELEKEWSKGMLVGGLRNSEGNVLQDLHVDGDGERMQGPRAQKDLRENRNKCWCHTGGVAGIFYLTLSCANLFS